MMVVLILNINILQKPSHGHKRDSSSVRSKSSMLEKAITDLEKMVAECKLYSSFEFLSSSFVLNDILGLFQFPLYAL